MEDILGIGKLIVETGSTAALLGVMTVLAIPVFRKKVFGNGNGKEGLKTEVVALIEQNHFHATHEKIDKLTEGFEALKDEMIRHNSVEVEILRDIKDKIK